MALSVKISRTTPIHPRSIFVQWDLMGVTEAGTYLFDVYRGGSPSGPWTQVLAGGVNAYNYLDRMPSDGLALSNDPNVLSLSRGIFYRVVATPPSGAANQVETVSVVEPTLEGRQRLLKRKFLRDLAMGLKKLNGIPVAVVKRMHWGERCTKCFDKYTKEVVRGSCTTCLGTGFIPGYHKPVITLARRSTSAVETSMAPEGKTDINIVQVWMLDAPRVEEDDILVYLRDNRRFLVKKMLPTELQSVTVHQKLVASELAKSSIEFRIVVDPTKIPPLF